MHLREWRLTMYVLDPIAWSILLMLLGCALLVVEVFVPSGGIIGVLSAVAFIGAILLAFQSGPAAGFAFTLSTAIVVPVLLAAAFKLWPKTSMGKAFLGEVPRDEEVLPEDPRRALIGKVGVARTKMLPSGAVEIDGQMVDAVSQGRAIEPGQYVLVTEVRGNRVVVRPADRNQRPSHQNPKDVLSRPIEELGIESLDDPLA